MGKAKEKWWRSAREILWRYPQLKKEHDELHSQSLTADLSGMPRGGSASRTTEMIALRQLPPADEQEYQEVTNALRITKSLPDGESKVKLIELMYFKHGGIKMENAALKVNVSYSNARRWHKEFLYLIAKLHGWKS